MRRFSVYFLLSLALHAAASLLLRESVVEPGRARTVANNQPAAMIIQLPPAPAPAAVAAIQPPASEPEKALPEPAATPLPPVARPAMVGRKAEPRAVAKQVLKPSKPVMKPAPPKPVLNETAEVALPTAATAAGPVSPAPKPAVTEVLSNRPSYLQAPKQPRYPNLAKRRNQQGVVVLEVRLDERGQQRALQIVRSSGVESLDEAALEAVADWQFRPETVDGRAVPSRVQIPIEFALTASR